MYVVTVEFEIAPDEAPAFMVAMHRQAHTSRTLEPGCIRFDVCVNETDHNTVFLYEIYSSRQCFQDHLESDHFKAFDKEVGPMVVNKAVGTWTLEKGTAT